MEKLQLKDRPETANEPGGSLLEARTLIARIVETADKETLPLTAQFDR